MIKVKKVSKLNEKTRYEKETGQKYDITDIFKSKVVDHPAQYAFTMVDIPKIGINPKTRYETPAGVYFYPLTPEYYEKLIEAKLPFANDKKFVGLAKLNWGANWLKLIDSSNGTEQEAQKAEEYLRNKYKFDIKKVEETPRNIDFSNHARIFVLTYFCSREVSKKDGTRSTIAFSKILRELGYDGVYDSGNSIIHPSEPTQLVCLDLNAYQQVGVYETATLRALSQRTQRIGQQRREWGLSRASMDKFWRDFAKLPPDRKEVDIAKLHGGVGVEFSLFQFQEKYGDVHALDNSKITGTVAASSIKRLPRNMTVIGTLKLFPILGAPINVSTTNLDLRDQSYLPEINFQNLVLAYNYTNMSFPDGLNVKGNLAINPDQVEQLPDNLTVGGKLLIIGDTLLSSDLANFPKNMKIGSFSGYIETGGETYKYTDISQEELQSIINKGKKLEEIKFRWRRYV